jgi:hypothetical protein
MVDDEDEGSGRLQNFGRLTRYTTTHVRRLSLLEIEIYLRL